ncbi:MAG: hypothetical protein KO464_06285 [Candidatus Methanofastidiosum sp.]|nr:hypothetical protein [Methanofastidiosum sp.]
MILNCKGLNYSEINKSIRKAIENGEKEISLNNINGQGYLFAGIKNDIRAIINGVPGNDLGGMMDGPNIFVNANIQDCVGNTMNNGKIVVHGDAGDILGYAMRGGKIFVKGKVGYRCGIHMKAFGKKIPVIVIGENAGDFLGEYMASGIIVVLCKNKTKLESNYIGVGMHGGAIYIRGNVDEYNLGKGVAVSPLDEWDVNFLTNVLSEYSSDMNSKEIYALDEFVKLSPLNSRPFQRLYSY